MALIKRFCDFSIQSASQFSVGRFWLLRCRGGRIGMVPPCRKCRVSICETQFWFGLLGSDGDSVACHRRKTCPESSWPGRALQNVSLANPRPSGPGAKVGLASFPYPEIPARYNMKKRKFLKIELLIETRIPHAELSI